MRGLDSEGKDARELGGNTDHAYNNRGSLCSVRHMQSYARPAHMPARHRRYATLPARCQHNRRRLCDAALLVPRHSNLRMREECEPSLQHGSLIQARSGHETRADHRVSGCEQASNRSATGHADAPQSTKRHRLHFAYSAAMSVPFPGVLLTLRIIHGAHEGTCFLPGLCATHAGKQDSAYAVC